MKRSFFVITRGNLVFILLLIGILLFSCGSSIKVGYDFNTKENFAGYKTFNFMEHPQNLQMREYVLSRIKHAITNELNQKGLKMSEEKPDLLIAIHTQVNTKVNISSWGYNYAPYVVYWGSYGYYGDYGITARQYNKGTLVVDLVEPKTKEMIWRGVAESALPETPRSEQLDKVISKAVEKMMKNYPPPPKQK
jgi:hypothetical protein